jgi:hypothetical protein
MKQPQAIYEDRTAGVNILLFCGIFSAALYIGMNVFIPMLYRGYDVASQTVSELSAIDTPTRRLWVLLGSIYGILVVFFGRGVYKAAAGNRKLKIAGIVIMLYAVVGLFWPPMHQRQVIAAGGGTLTDTLHIVFTFITVPLMLATTVIAGLSLGRQFMTYSFITVVTQIVFGVLTGLDAPAMEAGLPTPFMGIWERISIGANILWQMVFAIRLIYRVNAKAPSPTRQVKQEHVVRRKHKHTQGVD